MIDNKFLKLVLLGVLEEQRLGELKKLCKGLI